MALIVSYYIGAVHGPSGDDIADEGTRYLLEHAQEAVATFSADGRSVSCEGVEVEMAFTDEGDEILYATAVFFADDDLPEWVSDVVDDDDSGYEALLVCGGFRWISEIPLEIDE